MELNASLTWVVFAQKSHSRLYVPSWATGDTIRSRLEPSKQWRRIAVKPVKHSKTDVMIWVSSVYAVPCRNVIGLQIYIR